MGELSKKNLKNLFSTSRIKMEDAFNCIYEEYSYLVYYVSLKIVKRYDIAENITNETFMNFYINKEKIKHISYIKNYLVNISKNLSINYYNAQKRLSPLNEDILIVNEEKDCFEEYIEKFKGFLDEEEIDLIVFRFLYEFTFKEIAKMKNVSINTLYSRYKNALKKVKEHYKEEMFK